MKLKLMTYSIARDLARESELLTSSTHCLSKVMGSVAFQKAGVTHCALGHFATVPTDPTYRVRNQRYTRQAPRRRSVSRVVTLP